MQTRGIEQKNSDDLVEPQPKKTRAEALAYIQKLQKSHKRLRLISVSALIVVVIGTLVGGSLYYSWQKDPIPAGIASRVDFPLYYPTEFPSGFSLDEDSFSENDEVVTYTVTYEGDKKLIFNIQSRPTNFDFDGFQSKGKKINSSLGDAYVGALGKNTVVSITTDKSWLFIGVPSPIDTSSLEVILQHLKRSN